MTLIVRILAWIVFPLITNAVFAAVPDGLFNGATGEPAHLESILKTIPKGSIVVIGENHGLANHQNQQLQIMNGLRDIGHQVSVGLEFFAYPFQNELNLWRLGLLTEAEFLEAIGWGGVSFQYYRDQALFPNIQDGSVTIALNAPRSLTSQVAKSGMSSLSPELKALLPPDFSLGRESYRERFFSKLPHVPDELVKNQYFAAQSIWDDTMAWRAQKFTSRYQMQTLVIIVGDFHVQYGGGLPDRLRARTQLPIVTFSQLNSFSLSRDEVLQEMRPDQMDGPRADWVWVDESRVKTSNPCWSPSLVTKMTEEVGSCFLRQREF